VNSGKPKSDTVDKAILSQVLAIVAKKGAETIPQGSTSQVAREAPSPVTWIDVRTGMR